MANKWVIEIFGDHYQGERRRIISNEKTQLQLPIKNAQCLISTQLENKNSGNTRMIVCNTFNKNNQRTHQFKSIAHCPDVGKPSNNKTAFLSITDTTTPKSSIHTKSFLIKLYCNEIK